MKRYTTQRIVIAWILLLSLMPFYVVKSTHHHDCCLDTTTTGNHEDSSDHQCFICHFTLSPFVETNSFQAEPVFFTTRFETNIIIKSISLIFTIPFQLRGPPAAIGI